jgi:hypothetical protein
MQRVSTNLTLFFKLFIPVFWIIFFGALTGAFWMSDLQFIGAYPARPLKIGMLVFFLVGVALLYWSVMRLKRVEMDAHFVYVTNYFKHFRYPYHNIEKIEEKDYLLFHTFIIRFKTPGRFGKQISFIASWNRFQHFLDTHPNVVGQLMEKAED